MLILLSGCYAGLIWLIFFKLELLPWNKLSRNISILVGVAGLLAVAIGLVQGSPSASGGIQFVAKVTSLSAASPGIVAEAPSESYQPMKKGDLILAIDPTPYQARVQSLEAQLVAAQSGVEEMKAAVAASEADVARAESELDVWEPTMQGATASRESSEEVLKSKRAQLKSYEADLRRNEFNVKTAETQVERIRKLVAQEIESKASLDSAENKVVAAKAALVSAQATFEAIQDDLRVQEANVRVAKATEEKTRDQRTSLLAQLDKAKAAREQARQRLESTIDGEHTSVRTVREQLKSARYDLEQTRILAPDDGYLVGFGMTKGDYAGKVAFATFVATDRVFAVATFDQTVVRHIKPGQDAEIALRSRPGEIIPARVQDVIWATGEAQVPTGGTIAMVDQIKPSGRVGVRFEVPAFEGQSARFGASGQVAVYTDHAQPISVIRKIVLRMSSLLYYLG